MNSIKKRLLSVCLAVLMIVGLMPANALAEDGSATGSAVQIGNYYKVDDENGGKLNDSPTLAEGSTLKSYENGFVTINKTIEGTDTENEFIIKLDVKTKEKIEHVELSEDAAVVLVIDTSNSMVNDQGPKDSWYNRIEEAQKAAQAFINSFVEEDATRKVAIVKFSGNHQGWGVTGATVLQDWEDASALKTDSERTFCDSLKGLKQDGGTNIEAGLILATNLLKDSELDDIKNKNIILLTDGQPTYGVNEKEASSTSIRYICLNGNDMIGNGSASAVGSDRNDKLHEIHERVEAKVKSIQEAGIGTYAVYVGDAKLTCGEKNCLKDTSGENWLKDAGFTAFAASDAENELTTIFEEISKIIEMQAKAWILKDPMGSNIQFKGFVNEGEDRVCVADEITWNLRLAEATETKEGDETAYQYGLSYRIKLDNLKTDFDESKYYATNGPTSLSYWLTTNDNGEETYKLGYAYANIPSVKGLEGSLSFNKVGSFGEVLPGATFTLTTKDDENVSWSAASDEHGQVSFAGIPSGHAYILTETGVPTGYNGTDAKKVTISYGAVSGDLVENNNVINTSKTTTITVEKKWEDGNDQDGLRPDSITVQLLADKGPAHEAVVITPDAEGNWKYTWTDLELYYGGDQITYSVEEVNVPDGYESNEENFIITNTHTPATTEKTVTKVWQDAGDQDGIRPDSITVQLLADGTAYGEAVTIPAAAGDTWTYTWNNLPVNKEGEPIVYTVEELNVPEAYTAEAAGMTITNSYTPATRDITVTKDWVDGDNQDGNRPDSILVQLYANGEKVGEPVSLSAENGWVYTYEGLAQKANGTDIEYTVEELDVPEEYTVTINGFDITNSYDPKVTFVTVTKEWDDADNQDGIRPESITVYLYADGIGTDKSVVLNEENEWTATFEGLQAYHKGQQIDYYVVEAEVEGYESVVSGSASDGYIITNTHEPATVSVGGIKTWNDNNNQDGIRPESITVNLLANGEKIDSKVVTEEDEWTYDFGDQPKYENGVEVVYTVEEEKVEGYTAETEGYDLTNTHAPELTQIPVSKVWKDTDDKDQIRPDSITVKLLANGEETGLVMTLSAKYDWKGTFAEIPVYENGVAIEYTVEEVAVEGYTTTITGNAEEGFVITNSHAVTPDTGDHSNPGMYAALTGVCAAGLMAMLVLKKKAKRS